jgi:hypothetical protein
MAKVSKTTVVESDEYGNPAPASESAEVAPAITQVMILGESKVVHVVVDVGESEEVPDVTWTSTGSILVDANPEDPTSATIYANTPGQGTVRASVNHGGRHTEIVNDVMVNNEPSVVPSNRIEFE